MKYMIKNLSDKITAVIIYLLLAELVVALFLAIDCMADYHFYSSDADTYALNEAFRVKTNDEFDDIEYYTTLKFSEVLGDITPEEKAALERVQYTIDNSNLVFVVTNTSGNILFKSYGDNDTFDPETEACFKNSKHFSFSSEEGKIIPVTITIYIRSGTPHNDSYKLVVTLIKIAKVVRYPIFGLLIVMILATVLVLGLLMSSIGRYDPEKGEAKPVRFLDKIPFDLMTLLMICIVAFIAVLIVLTSVAGIKHNNLVLWNSVVLILAFFISATMLVFCVSLATRIKYGHVYKNTLVFRLIARIRKAAGKENEGYFKVPFTSKMLITIGSVLLLEILTTLYYLYKYKTITSGVLSEFKFLYFAVFQIIITCIIGALFFMMSVNLYHVRVSGKKIASGDFDYNTDSRILFGDFKEISDDFADIKDDMIKALEEKNKSIEMRNELIANISHDIKTPLTSIINYSDIVSSGGCSEEELKNYLDVIGRQSAKLSDLLQNLIEVSKLNSGIVEAQFESLDICLYLSQIVDEMSYILSEKELDVIFNIPEKELLINCDSSLLWRVFENLIGNIGKYSMPGTGVFIDISENDGKAVISFKNTSATHISSTPEDLLTRFRRDDKSRHTGGNGLGLSIAKSFTEIQNGTFDVIVDGDLFKTVLTFNITK